MPFSSGQASRQKLRRYWPHFVWGGVLAVLLILLGLNVGNLRDGITESLINSLSQLPNLAVMSRNTVFRYKGLATDPQKVGHDLHVRAILTGRLIQTGDDLMISVNLEDVQNSRQIWGEQYNRKLSNLVSVQQEIAGDIYGRLRPRAAGVSARKCLPQSLAVRTRDWRACGCIAHPRSAGCFAHLPDSR